MREILTELIEAVEAGRRVAYTALVETRGSTPQKAGAAMLVYEDGSQAGTLGGGCVEAEVKRRALRLPLSCFDKAMRSRSLNVRRFWVARRRRSMLAELDWKRATITSSPATWI